jgi:hypothetical protein
MVKTAALQALFPRQCREGRRFGTSRVYGECGGGRTRARRLGGGLVLTHGPCQAEGCTEVQGDLLDPPAPVERIRALLAARDRRRRRDLDVSSACMTGPRHEGGRPDRGLRSAQLFQSQRETIRIFHLCQWFAAAYKTKARFLAALPEHACGQLPPLAMSIANATSCSALST